MAGPWEQFQSTEQGPWSQFAAVPPPSPEKQSAFRQIADVPLGIAKGAVQGVRMIADAFGAGSDTSKTIKSAETYLADLMSAQAKNDQQEISRIMKDAEDKGVLDQVKAGIKAFTVAPIDTLSSALGTAAPVIAGALGAKVLGAGALLTTGVSALTGAGMGAGTIKGSIYEETKKTLKEAGASEQDAEARAQLAQQYNGKNLDQILLGTVLGGAAAVGPLEKGGAAILARRILGKTGTEATETVAGQAAKGAVRRRLEAGALEAVPEAVQAGQEQVAQNIALQREGFDVPTFRGAAGAMTLEALAGAGLGATVGGGKPAVAPEVPPAPPVAPPPVAPPPAAPEAEAPVAAPPVPPAGPTPEELARIQDEHETAIIEGLIAQDVEMARAKQLAEQRAQEQSEAEFLESGIKETDRRVREGRIFARVQDLIDRNIPFASTAINDINQKFGVINEAPLTEEERARVENIMGMVSTFTNFVNLPVLAPKPMDPFAENQQMEALIRERTERGQAQPIRTAPAAPSPSVQETPVSQGVGEGPAVRPPSGVKPSVAEDSELVTPAPAVEAAAPVVEEPSVEAPAPKVGDLVKLTVPGVGGPIGRAGKIERLLPNGDVEIRTQQGEIVSKSPEQVTVVTPAPADTKAKAPTVEAAAPVVEESAVPAAPAPNVEIAAPKENYTSIPTGLVANGYTRLERSNPRRFKEFGTWEKDGVRISVSSNVLMPERGAVTKYAADEGEITLEALLVDPDQRQKGKAREALNLVTNLADDLGVELYLEPVQLEKGAGMNADQLRNFYASAGFEPTDKSGKVMVRKPRKSEDVSQTAPAAPTVEAAAPKAEAPPTLDTTGITKAAGRHPQVQAAAKLLQEKKMSREEFEKYVDAYKPIETIKAETLYPPSSVESMVKAIRGEENKKKINIPIADGIRVGLRMDLPARDQGVPVVSIHEGKPNDDPKTGKPYKSSGKVIGYGSTGYIKDVFFAPRDQEKSLVMGIEPVKNPLQTAEGTWVNLSPEETYTRVKELMKDPAWKQVGFDPARHGYFYDRKTREPVVSASEMYQVGQFLLAKDVEYAPKENYLYSVEPTVKSDRLPSYKRGVENLRKRWEKGDLTSDEFAARVDILAKQVEMAELAKEKSSRERGADFLRQRLLEAKRRGELSPEAVDFAEWFILQNPALVDDLGISIRTPKEDGVGGMYSSYGRVMYLMKERGSDQTVVHEILHHLERMMPKEVQSAIRKTWIKSLMEAQKNAKTDAEKQFFKNLTDFHFGFGSRSLMKSAIDAIKNGDVSKDLYQYTSPSEFWAENGSEIMRGRFDVKGSVLGRLKQWLSELKEKARSLFGLENKAAIIRSLDSLSKGDGKFVSKTLLDEGTEPKLSVTQQGTPGEQAISIVNQMKMGIPPAKPTFGQQTIAILKGEQQLPTLDLKTAKEVAMKFSDTFEKNIFSADAAFENAVRRGVREAVKDNDKVIGLVLQAGQSQTVNIDNVVSRGIIEGASEYNEDMQKWQSVQKKENLKAQTAKLEEISKKYNLPLDEVKSVAHAYLVTKRLPGILERNAKFTAEIDAEQKTAKPDRKKIEELKALLVYVSPTQQAQMEPGQSLVKLIPELEQVSDIWQGMRKNTIKTMVEGGLWSEEYAESMLDNIDYVPYFRVEQLEEDAGPLEFVRGLQVKSKEHRLKGSDSPVNDVFDNQVRWMQYAMSRTMRAHKARQMIDVAKDIDIGGRKMAVKVTEQERGMNIVRIYRDGKQEMWDVADPNFIDAFAAIQNVSIPMFKWAAKAAEILRNTVVLYPLFSVAQVPQDSFAAMFTSGLKPQHALKIPYLAVQEFIKTISKTSATHNELKKFGVVGARDFSADVMRKDAEIEAGLKQPKGVWGKTKEILEHVAMAGDNAVRQATYIASKQQGLSEKEALEKAFEIFNVRRRGTSKALNLAGQTIPFFYAYLAAQRVAYRTITGVGTSPTERKAALTTLAATSASVMVLSMIYAMMVGDDEDYADTPAAVRDRTLTIPGTGGVRIPLRPDFFLFPKIIAEHTYQLITDKGYEDGAKFRTSMFDALVNATLSPTPIPQIVKPILEVAINYDFFQGKPLIGTFEKNKDLERQFRDTTSELAKLFGKTGMVSPIAVDHLIRGMLGSFGGLMLYGTNMFLHSDPDVPRPEMSANEMLAALPGTAGFLKRPQESALKNDFFVLRDEVEKAANTFNDIKTRSPEGIQAFLEDEKNAIRLGMAKGVDKINRHLSDIRRRMTIITNMPESQMPADEKAENIRELRELEREILRSVNVKELREMAKI
jgi:hypothetical protein